MGERKVLNRYIPPDFDPSIIPKFKREKGRMIEVRMMLPFSLRCNTCGEYMYRGKKFNSKTERIQDDDYLGIRKLRFYIKCSHCSAEITFKTDPKNADYECESGASRNFEVWRDNEAAIEEATKEREDAEEQDAMKALEHRTTENKNEMDIIDALEEIQDLNYRNQRLDPATVLLNLDKKRGPEDSSAQKGQLTKEDEELVKSIKFGKNQQTSSTSSAAASINQPQSGSSGMSIFANNLQKSIQKSVGESKQQQQSMIPAIITRKRKIDPSTTTTSNDKESAEIESNSQKLQKKEEPVPQSTSVDPAKTTTETTKQQPENNNNASSTGGGGLFSLLGDYDSNEEEE
jgi:Zn finger protein HypA/HybF involved in hydrogenase expression